MFNIIINDFSTNPSPVVAAIEPTSPLSESSTYFTTSEPKAKFLTRYGPGMNDSGVIRSTKDLSQKKVRKFNYKLRNDSLDHIHMVEV